MYLLYNVYSLRNNFLILNFLIMFNKYCKTPLILRFLNTDPEGNFLKETRCQLRDKTPLGTAISYGQLRPVF
jgi:hypothetical protein